MAVKERHAWWIPTDDPYITRTIEGKARRHEETIPENFSVKLCPKCNRAYDPPVNTSKTSKTHNEYFLRDFPKYGLEQLTCKYC